MQKNEAYEAILARRSVRDFDPGKPIDEETLNAILLAGEYAPSAMNRQPCRIVVLRDPAARETIRRMNCDVMGTDGDPFYGAPVVLIVLADRSIPTHVEDGSLVMGNLMNAASALGVDSIWINRAKEEFASDAGKALLKAWKIEGDWAGIAHCALGYSRGGRPAPKPRKEGWIVRI